MDAGIAALGGAIVGGLLTGLAPLLLERHRDKKDSRQWSIAVGAEAAALARMIRARGWADQIAEYGALASIGEVYAFSVAIPASTLTVSRAAVLRAGTLVRELPALVPQLVVVADGLIVDFERLRLPLGHDDNMVSPDAPDSAVKFYAELAGLLDYGLRVCDRIVSEVRAKYPDARIEVAAVPLPSLQHSSIPPSD